jgi:hypothetical protein
MPRRFDQADRILTDEYAALTRDLEATVKNHAQLANDRAARTALDKVRIKPCDVGRAKMRELPLAYEGITMFIPYRLISCGSRGLLRCSDFLQPSCKPLSDRP